MFIKNQRFSDVVAGVCIPMSLFLYIHVMSLSNELPRDIIINPDYEGTQQREPLQQQPQSNHPSDLGPFINRIVPPPLNNTVNGREDLLLFTPIVRAGSTMMRNLLKNIREQNDFIIIDEMPKKKNVVHIPKTDVQKNIAGNISSIPDTAAMIQSFAHIDFASFGYKGPIFISIVREPVSRAISWFYSVRAPFQLVERQFRFPDLKLPSKSFLKKDIESCLKDRRDQECRYVEGREKLGHTIEFFCGHHSECRLFGSRTGLEMAKRNVEMDFAVVGILEEWDKTMAVLEHYIPKFFSGATQVFYDKLSGAKSKLNENFYKPRVEDKAIEELRRNLTVEAEFYDFLKKRLHQQYLAIT